MSDKCIACQFVKNPVEVRFLGHEMWIMDSGGGVRVGEKAISVLTGNNPILFDMLRFDFV